MVTISRSQIQQISRGKAPVSCKNTNVPQVTITLCMYFAIGDAVPPVSRWQSQGLTAVPVIGATVSLGGATCVTDGDGKAYFDAAPLRAGSRRLSVTPPAGMAASAPAGPDFALGTAQESMPQLAFRPFTGTIQVNKKQFVTPRTKHTLQSGIQHARIIASDKKDILIDYRPDFVSSPNAYPREKKSVRLIVLHRTSADTTAIGATLSTFQNSATVASAHYVVDRDGFIVKMVQETSYAYHAGCSLWHGKWDLNAWTVGIEIVAAADKNEAESRPDEQFTEAQYAALIDLVHSLLRKYGLTRHAVVGHSDINTKADPVTLKCVGHSLGGDRVMCPGKEMDWPRLGRSGIGTRADSGTGLKEKVSLKYHGFFAIPRKDGTKPRLCQDDHDDGNLPKYGAEDRLDMKGTGLVATLRGDLLRVGYSVSDDYLDWAMTGAYRGGQLVAGTFEAATLEAVKCFQRHFMRRGGRDVVWGFDEEIAMVLEAVLQDISEGDRPFGE